MKGLLKRLFGRRDARFDDELQEEIAFHSEMKQRELEAAGLSAEEARRTAAHLFGNASVVAEDSRAQWSFRWVVEASQDLRYGVRALAQYPVFAVATVLALTLGIGVNAVVFNVWNTLAWQQWAVRDAASTVNVLAGRDGEWSGVSWPHFRYLREHSKTTSGVVAFNGGGAQLVYRETAWKASLNVVSDNFLDVLGTGYAVGRGFSTVTNPKDPPAEIVLHYDHWQKRFGGDPGVVGQWVEFGGQRLQIVGVTREGFSGPIPEPRDVWVLLEMNPKLSPGMNWDDPTTCCINLMARVRSDSNRETVQAELSTLSTQFLQSVGLKPSRMLVTPPTLLANPTMRNRVSMAFAAIGTATFLILLLACANVANLQIARCLARGREIATRLSLGASRGRILRQMVTENLILSAVAGAISLAISNWLPLEILRRIVPDRVALQFANDWRVGLFVVLLVMVTAPLIGMLPAIGAVKSAMASGLRGDASHFTGGMRTRTALVGVQVALVMTLLGGASLLARALEFAKNADPGFQVEGVSVVEPHLAGLGLDDARSAAPLAAVAAQLRSLPVVERVAHATVIPFGNFRQGTSVEHPANRSQVAVGLNFVSAGFVETLGLKVVDGRSFTEADEAGGDKLMLTHSTARLLWPGESAVGKVLRVGRPMEVVGVLRDFSIREIGAESGELHVLRSSRGSRFSQVLVRHRGGDGALDAIGKKARLADKSLTPEVALMSSVVDRARHAARVAASVAWGLSLLSLVLAAVGIYGVAAFNVARRTREIGLRMALGAGARNILGLVLGQNLTAVGVGVMVGIAGTLGFGVMLRSLLYGVQPHDPAALAMAAGILLTASGVAAWLPARRAVQVDPAVALRHD